MTAEPEIAASLPDAQAPSRGTLLLGIACFLGGVLFEVTYGRLGFMPLDHSIVFDGGWRILSGQVPWRDFDLPSAVTPSYLQALFFGLGGVNWGSYIAHAAVLNGLFCVIVFAGLARLGLHRGLATCYGLASGALLFTPVGVPFPDQHAFFFTTLGLYLGIVARTAHSRRTALLAWSLVPTALVLSLLSKQLPGGLSPLLLVAIFMLPGSRPRREILLGLSLGSVLLALLTALFFAVTGADFARAFYQLVERPYDIATRRVGRSPRMIRLPKGYTVLQGIGQGFWSVSALHLTTLILAVVALVRRTGAAFRSFGLALSGEVLMASGMTAIIFANNHDAIAVGWFFAALGVGHAALASSVSRKRLTTRFIVGALFLVILARDTVVFTADINVTRVANDMRFDSQLAERAAPLLPPELSALRWTIPTYHGYPPEDLAAVLEYIKAADGDFFLMGDCSILYGLARRRSVSPALWFHPSVTLPPNNKGPEFRAWEERLLAAFEGTADRAPVRRIVEERAGTWSRNWTLKDLHFVWETIQGRIVEEHDFGAFRILELSE